MLDLENKPALTAEEIAQIRQNALNATHPASWIWDEECMSYIAPISPPADGFPYLWDETIVNWTPFPSYPRG
jgi:hypothetical protein